MTKDRLSAAHSPEQLQFVVFDWRFALRIVTVDRNGDLLARIELVFVESDFGNRLGRSEKFEAETTDLIPNLHLESARFNLYRLIENLNSSCASKETHVLVETWESRIFDQKGGIFGRKLGSQGVFDRKPITLCLKHDTFGEPCGQINLKRVGKLAWTDTLTLSKHDNLLLYGDDFLGFAVKILHFPLQLCGQMTSLDAFKFEGQI